MNIRKALGIRPDQEVWEIIPSENDYCPCQRCGHPPGECMCEKNEKVRICEYVERLQSALEPEGDE